MMMTPPTITSIHCPSCGRHLTEAEEIKGQRLRCKGCGAHLQVDLQGGVLTVSAEKAP
jgi:transposase-like protein